MATALEGKGAVPDIPLFGAVVKRLFELPTAKTFASNGLPVHWPAGFDFTADGLSAQVPAPHAQRPSRRPCSRHAPRLKPRALTPRQAPDARRSVMYAASPRRLTPACVPALSQELRTFFSSLLHASRGTDPIIESGNKYGKTDVSHRMNGALLMPLTTALALA